MLSKAAPVEFLLLDVQGQHAVCTRCGQIAVTEVIADGTPEQQKAVINMLFGRMEQRNGQIERFVLHSWVRGLL